VVVERLLRFTGFSVHAVYGEQGKQYLRKRIGGYDAAAQHAPWLVVVDLDDECACEPELVHAWLPARAIDMRLRVAVRQIESWLLADRAAAAKFFSVAQSHVPADPDAEQMEAPPFCWSEASCRAIRAAVFSTDEPLVSPREIRCTKHSPHRGAYFSR
jgi:hypothetical protein